MIFMYRDIYQLYQCVGTFNNRNGLLEKFCYYSKVIHVKISTRRGTMENTDERMRNNETYADELRLRVTLAMVASPKRRYPKNPMRAYMKTSIIMEMLSTPGQPRKCCGFFMTFSIGNTCKRDRL